MLVEMLQFILKKEHVKMQAGFIWLKTETSYGLSWTCYNESHNSIKRAEFLD
jgi:hypothetical protein